MVTMRYPDIPDDPAVPALAVLLGPGASDVLNAVLEPAGARTGDARPIQVRYRPGQSIVAQYTAAVVWEDGRKTTETLVAGSGGASPAGTAVVEADGVEIAIWRYPNDPHLPGLAAASDPGRVGALLRDLGAPGDRPRLRRRAYRPGRRAVIEATTSSARIYLKVVRPSRVAELQARHASMTGHIPVPASHGWSSDLGLVALQAMPGKTMRKALESGTRRLPSAGQILDLLDALPDPPAVATPVAGPAARAVDHAELLRTVAPSLADRIGALVDAVGATTDEPEVPVHGDFHSSQILVRQSDIVGLIDVDTTGAGARVDDLAGLLGHLSTLSLRGRSRQSIDRYATNLVDGFDRVSDPASLRLHTAAVVLGLATGPFRVQETNWPGGVERRIALAERWIDSAADVA